MISLGIKCLDSVNRFSNNTFVIRRSQQSYKLSQMFINHAWVAGFYRDKHVTKFICGVAASTTSSATTSLRALRFWRFNEVRPLDWGVIGSKGQRSEDLFW